MSDIDVNFEILRVVFRFLKTVAVDRSALSLLSSINYLQGRVIGSKVFMRSRVIAVNFENRCQFA
jgi:hypothetical protein